uniref:Peptidase S1 domain-containing protein n=1 Tax=Panagrolaimus sp. ES5 TaxID=591445 RepID=A0AC34FPT0_9BILA
MPIYIAAKAPQFLSTLEISGFGKQQPNKQNNVLLYGEVNVEKVDENTILVEGGAGGSKGDSGGPLVDENGDLVGVLMRGQADPTAHYPLVTLAVNLNGKEVTKFLKKHLPPSSFKSNGVC